LVPVDAVNGAMKLSISPARAIPSMSARRPIVRSRPEAGLDTTIAAIMQQTGPALKIMRSGMAPGPNSYALDQRAGALN